MTEIHKILTQARDHKTEIVGFQLVSLHEEKRK